MDTKELSQSITTFLIDKYNPHTFNKTNKDESLIILISNDIMYGVIKQFGANVSYSTQYFYNGEPVITHFIINDELSIISSGINQLLLKKLINILPSMAMHILLNQLKLNLDSIECYIPGKALESMAENIKAILIRKIRNGSVQYE